METRKWKTIRKWDYSQGLSSPPLHNSFVVFSLQISFNSMLLCTHGSNIYSPVSFSLNCRVSIKDQLGLLSQSQKIQEREFNSAWIRQPPLIQTSERRWVSWSNYRGYLPVWHNYKKWQYKWQELNELWPLLKPQGFQRYHLVFLSSLQGSTAVQPDPQITDKCLLCSLPVGCLGQRKKSTLLLSNRNLFLVPPFLFTGGFSAGILPGNRQNPAVHKNVLESWMQR